MTFQKANQKRVTSKLDPAVIKARRDSNSFQSVRLCNCARCDREMIGESGHSRAYQATYYALPIVFGRLSGRPYCEKCYRAVETFQGRKVEEVLR